MTSVQRQSRNKAAFNDVGNDSDAESTASREGIFDQFANECASPMLYYYTIQSSSDSEGNITLHDIKKEKFGSDVKVMSDDSDESGDENEEDENTSSRYRLRTRRLKKQDDEFDMFLCGDSSDDMAMDEKAMLGELSSDDETYDVTTDNWTYVRCGKKKATQSEREKAGKKTPSPKKPANKLKAGKLRIKLRSAFERRGKAKPVPTRSTASPKKSAGNVTASKTKKTSSKVTSSAKASSRNGSPSKPASKAAAKNFKAKSALSKKKDTSPVMTQSSSPVASLHIALSKKRLLRRCGYNPTAPKISEIRHIRRRQLKQNPKRAKRKSESDAFMDGDLSASSSDDERMTSDEETVPAPGPARGFKTPHPSSAQTTPKMPATSRPNDSAAIRTGANCTSSSTSAITTATSTELTVSSSNAITTSSGRGIKLVIRRQSVENREAVAKASPGPAPKDANQINAGKPELKFMQSKNLRILKTVRVKSSGLADKAPLPPTLPTVAVDAATPRQDNNPKQQQNGAEEREPIENAQQETDSNLGRSPIVASESVNDDANDDAQENCDVTSKQTNEETTKKKKSKKKKKKDRGRPSVSAAADDSLDAEETAMRLAMELPRHNWLVKHLIKENKLKAEDAKPLNQSPGEERKTTEELNKEESKSTGKEPTSSPVHKEVEKEEVNVTNDIKGELSKEELQLLASKDSKISAETDIFKTANNVKASSMVGIVKPFQHLKMFPASIVNEGCGGNGDGRESSYNEPMSPPALCIVDEDDPPEMEENMKAGKMPGHDPNLNSDPNKNVSNGCKEGNPMQSPSRIPTLGHQPLHNHTPSHSNTNGIEASTDTALTDEFGPNSTTADTSPEIKISNCFSLIALDLTNKTPEKKTDPNLPLDLSIGTKQGGESPEVLDLSVKKTPSFESPKTAAHGTAQRSQTADSSTSGSLASVSKMSCDLPVSEMPLDLHASKMSGNLPPSNVIVIEDIDDGSFTETTAMTFQNNTSTCNTEGGKERIKDCFVRLTDTAMAAVSASGPTQYVGPHPPQMRMTPVNPKMRQVPEKSLKRHVSAPALPNNDAGPGPAKRHQSVDSAQRQDPSSVSNAAQINTMSMLQTLTAKTCNALNVSTSISALKRICSVDSASAKKRKLSEEVARRAGPSHVQGSIQAQQLQQYQPQRAAMPPRVFQASNSQPGFQGSQTMRGMAPQVGVRLEHVSGPSQIKLPPNMMTTMAEQLQPPLGANIELRMPPNPALLVAKKPPPSSQNVPRTQLRAPTPGHIKLAPAPSRPRMPAPNCRVQAQPFTPQFSLYSKVPQDVNNNNVATVISSMHPGAAVQQGRVVYNPPQTGYPQTVEHPTGGVLVRQAVRAPPGGANIDRLVINQQPNRSVNTPGNNPPRRTVILPTDHSQPPGHVAYPQPAVQDILQQQQRAVEEKIQQLEALKQQLKMQQHNVDVQSKHQLSQQQQLLKQQQKLVQQRQHQQQQQQQHALANRFSAPTPRRHAPPNSHIPPNQTLRMPVRQQVTLSQTQAIRQQLQTIQSQAASIARGTPAYQPARPLPYYRNGGLTINKKDSLNEPIVIEDDAPTSQSLIARNRHSYSFHPPLSKNKSGTPEQTQRSATMVNSPAQIQRTAMMTSSPNQRAAMIASSPNQAQRTALMANSPSQAQRVAMIASSPSQAQKAAMMATSPGQAQRVAAAVNSPSRVQRGTMIGGGNGAPEQAQRVAAMLQQKQAQAQQARHPGVAQMQNQNNSRKVPESPVEVCIICQKKAFFLCSGCKRMWYCSKECQFKDWAQHSKKCSG